MHDNTIKCIYTVQHTDIIRVADFSHCKVVHYLHFTLWIFWIYLTVKWWESPLIVRHVNMYARLICIAESAWGTFVAPLDHLSTLPLLTSTMAKQGNKQTKVDYLLLVKCCGGAHRTRELLYRIVFTSRYYSSLISLLFFVSLRSTWKGSGKHGRSCWTFTCVEASLLAV